MNIFKKTIFTGFAPNLTASDVFISLGYLLPWNWPEIINGQDVESAEKKLESYFKIRSANVFDSGRSALYFSLKALDIKEGDEVLIQAYTCVVVTNAIRWVGAKPVYVDIRNDFNMDVVDLEKKITNKSKVLIIQHTFGLSAELNELINTAKKHGLRVVEDCAHSFGLAKDKKLTGTFGDIGMFSFGSDKILSCVRGGALITDNQELADKICKLKNDLPDPDFKVTLQHLMHGPIFFIGKKLYGLVIGKAILALAKKCNLINKIIYKEEKKGLQVDFYPAKMANSLATILLKQIEDVLVVNGHRQLIAKFYNKNLKNDKVEKVWADDKINKDNCVYLRYPILTDSPNDLLRYAKKHGIILGNWYDRVVAPRDIDFEKTGYVKGNCPNAEVLASRSVNLPTNRHIKIEDAIRVVELVNKYMVSKE